MDSVISIFPLDASFESIQHVASTLPIHKQSFLDLPLSLLCADSLQKIFIKNKIAQTESTFLPLGSTQRIFYAK